MAQQVQVVLLDDVDGGEAAETVTFGLDGVSYEIDLNEENAQALRDLLGQWAGHARRVGGRARSGGRTRPAEKKPDLADVRAWARENGYEISDRGRVAKEVIEAYEAAH